MSAGIAIVTGGSRGIGRAIVDRLIHDDMRVVTCGRGDRPADLPAAAHWATADVSRPSEAEHLVAEANRVFGTVSLLVNNAGVQLEKSVSETTDEDWDHMINANCRGVFNMCRGVLPRMERHSGVIVNIGSISGDAVDHGMALYNASKSFVHGLTRSIAVDHGPAVRCNAIQPGWVMTGMADDAFALAADPDAAREDALARHPAGRFGEPADIANAVAWLASHEARYITGQFFRLDGGLTAASPLNPRLF